MKPFIFEQRNSIYIINLSETVKQLQAATDFLANVARNGGKVLFIGCKKQAQEAVKEAELSRTDREVARIFSDGKARTLRASPGGRETSA